MLLSLLGYSAAAILVRDGGDFGALSASEKQDLVMLNDVRCDGEFPLFSGVLDGRGMTLTAAKQMFGRLRDAYVRNVTIRVEGAGAFAGALERSFLTNVRLYGAGFEHISATSVYYSYFEADGCLANTSEGFELRGSSVVVHGGVFIASSLSDVFSNSIITLSGSSGFMAQAAVLDLKMVRVVLAEIPHENVSAFGDYLYESSLTDVDFSFIMPDSDGCFCGLTPTLRGNMLSNMSVGAEISGTASEVYGIARWAADNYISGFAVYLLLSLQKVEKTVSGAFGVLEANNTVRYVSSYLRGCVNASTDANYTSVAVVGLFAELGKMPAQQMQLQQSFSNFNLEIHSARDSFITAAGLTQNGSVSALVTVGKIRVFCEAAEKQFVLLAYFVRKSAEVIVDSYTRLALEAIGKSQPVLHTLFTGIAMSCSGCQIMHSGCFSHPDAYNFRGVNISAAVFAGCVAIQADDALIDDFFASTTVYIDSMKNGSLAGLLTCSLSGTMQDVQVHLNVSVAKAESLVAALGFSEVDASAADYYRIVAVCVDCTFATDLNLALSGTLESESAFVDCTASGVNASQEHCLTSEEMKSPELLEVLGDRWAIDSLANGGYPYSYDTFVHNPQSGDVAIDQKTLYFRLDEWTHDAMAALVFPASRSTYCRGSCDGFAFSPAAFICSSGSDLCYLEDPTEHFYPQVCYSFNLGTSCDHGQTTCEPGEYVYEGLSCKQRCRDCGHGVCHFDGTEYNCLCEMYYSGASCADFDCRLQQTPCYGLGECVIAAKQPVCQCEDATFAYEDAQCAEQACPGLLANQGVCSQDGPVCFDRYEREVDGCGRCASGYSMHGDVCEDYTDWIIFGSVAGSLVLIIAIVTALYYIRRRKQPSAEEKYPLVDEY